MEQFVNGVTYIIVHTIFRLRYRNGIDNPSPIEPEELNHV